MSEYSIPKVLRILALKSVLEPDMEYFYRRVFRWYSREFHTPLYLVDKIPVQDILTAYYESRYEDIVGEDDNHRLIEELQELTETEQERIRREMKPDLEKVADEEYVAKVMKEEFERKKQTEISQLNTQDATKPALDNMDLPNISLNFDDPDENKPEPTWGFMDRPVKKP